MIELVKNASKVKLLMVQREFMIHETISAGKTISLVVHWLMAKLGAIMTLVTFKAFYK